MKNRYLVLLILCFLPILICDGVRVAINEKFIQAILTNFAPEIQKYAQGTELPDYSCLDRLKFSIPNFSLDKVNLSFNEQGLLNIQINGLSPELSGRISKKILVRITKSFSVSLRNFVLKANFKISSKKNDKDILVPDIYLDSDPTIIFTPKINLGKNPIFKALASILNGAANIAKSFAMPAIKKQLKKILNKVISGLPTEISIKNYKLDVSLSPSGIQLRNKFLEITSNARLFNPNIEETKTKEFTKVSFPFIETMGSQLQLYISEFSINSVIYTILTSNDKTLSTKIKKEYISKMIPGIERYGNEDPILYFIGTPEVSLEITEEYINVNLPGFLNINVGNEDILKLELKLGLKAKACIQNGEKFSAEIFDLDLNIIKIDYNKLSTDLSILTKGFSYIRNPLITLLNQYIKTKMELPFPTVMGVKFWELSVQHKSHYLQINYNLVRL